MKKGILILIAITSSVIMLSSCNEVDKLLTFSVYNQGSFTIQGGFPINSPIDIPTPDVTTNSTTAFSNNNTRADLVKDVKLQEIKLTITDPADETFSFLKTVEIYISTNDSDEIKLAWKENISSDSNTLNLTCTPLKLDKYVKSPFYKLRTKITTQETLVQDVQVQINMRFSVIADPI